MMHIMENREEMLKYDGDIERQMQRFYAALSEKDKRRYAAIEALKLGHGGKKYICDVLGCQLNTLNQGFEDLDDDEALALQRIRQPGGGRKAVLEQQPDIDETFLRVIHEQTAGSPMDEELKWTNLSRPQIAALLEQAGCRVSIPVVEQLLRTQNVRKRNAYKSIAGGTSEYRDDQFHNIRRLINNYQIVGWPILSVDAKKKELIGTFFRNGSLSTQERVHVNDHDFKSLAKGIAIPHALYDSTRHPGYITIGTSHDTSEFAVSASAAIGPITANISTPMLPLFSCSVIVVAAITPDMTSSRNSYRH